MMVYADVYLYIMM